MSRTLSDTLVSRLRSLRPGRPAPVRATKNDLLPATAWQHLVPMGEADRPGVSRWRRGWQLGEPMVNGGLEQLTDEVASVDDEPVSIPGSVGDRFDIALLVNPDFRMLTDLARRSAPDAVVVAEFHLHRTASIGALKRRLEQAGLDLHEVYSVSPSDDWLQPTFWLPTSHPAPAKALARSLSAARTETRGLRLFSRSLDGLLQLFPNVICNRPWLLFPNRSWVALAVARPLDGSMPPSREWSDPAGLRLLRIGGSSTDQPIVTRHDSQHHQPVAVTKFPSRRDEVQQLESEARNLGLLAKAAPDLTGLPKIIKHSAAVGSERPFLTQSYIPGVPLNSQLTPANFGRWLMVVQAWSSALADATRSRGEPLSEMAGRWLDDLTGGAPDLVERSRPILANVELNLRVMQHLDFGPWNIHGDETGVGVIDWATADPSGLPLCDLIHYATHAAAIVTGGYEPRALARAHLATIDEGTEPGRAVAAATAGYCAGLGIEVALAPALRLANWIRSVWRRPSGDRSTGIYQQLWELELTAIEAAADRDRAVGRGSHTVGGSRWETVDPAVASPITRRSS